VRFTADEEPFWRQVGKQEFHFASYGVEDVASHDSKMQKARDTFPNVPFERMETVLLDLQSGMVAPFAPRQVTARAAPFANVGGAEETGHGLVELPCAASHNTLYRPHSIPASAAKMAFADCDRSVPWRTWYTMSRPAIVVAPNNVPPSVSTVSSITCPLLLRPENAFEDETMRKVYRTLYAYSMRAKNTREDRKEVSDILFLQRVRLGGRNEYGVF
jgi:hypothetical protein